MNYSKGSTFLFLVAGVVFFSSRAATGSVSIQNASDTECAKSIEGQISGSDSFTFKKLTENSLELRLESGIAQSKKPVKFLTSIFRNDIQIPELTSTYVIECGKSHVLKSAVKNVTKQDIVSTFYWKYPDIPQVILDLNADRFKGISTPTLANIATFQTHTHRTETFMGAPSNVLANPVPIERVKQVPLDQLTPSQSYLVEQGADRPTLVKFLKKPGQFRFQMVFTETSNLTSPITITCLLDKRQVRAFGSAVSWSGRPKPNHGVVLDADINMTGPGWHQLECLIFDNLFQPSTRVPSTFWTLGTFIHIDNQP
jgi:hypothetical protein